MSLVLLIARLLLTAVFLVAGIAKLADLAGSRQALRDFGVPAVLARPFGLLLPLAELAGGVAPLFSAPPRGGALGGLGRVPRFRGRLGFQLGRGSAAGVPRFGPTPFGPC